MENISPPPKRIIKEDIKIGCKEKEKKDIMQEFLPQLSDEDLVKEFRRIVFEYDRYIVEFARRKIKAEVCMFENGHINLIGIRKIIEL